MGVQIPLRIMINCIGLKIEAITRNIALEFASFGIRANCIQAGVPDTASFRMIPDGIKLKKNSSSKKLRNELVKYYKKNKFIKILKLNSELGSGNVLNTNNCEISICDTRIKDKIVIFSAIDNLVKGASGQAIQNMNLLFNIKENASSEVAVN